MKQSEAKEFLPLIQAWADGKTVQIKYPNACEWLDMDPDNPRSFFYPIECYRIKPEPRTFYAVEWGDADAQPSILKSLERAQLLVNDNMVGATRVLTLREVLDE